MTVYVITHKNFSYKYLPQEYKELLVGANGKKNEHNYLTDNTGDNISQKNPSYCELTGNIRFLQMLDWFIIDVFLLLRTLIKKWYC